MPKKRKFNINNSNIFVLLIIAIYCVKIFSDIEIFLDLTSQYTILSLIDSYIEIIFLFLFFFFIFTRLSINEINKVFIVLLIFLFFQGILTFYTIFLAKDILIDVMSTNLLYESKEVYFGNRNEWSQIFAFLLVISIILLTKKEFRNWFFYSLLTISGINVIFSLSRRGYMLFIFGYLFSMLMLGKTRIIIVFSSIIAIFIIFFQPDIMRQRLAPTLDASTFEEVRYTSSGQFYDFAVEQTINNITYLPNSFSSDLEIYNASESFWSGLLYRQGILGILFQWFLLWVLFIRYYRYFRSYNRFNIYISTVMLINLTLIFLFTIMSFFTTICYYISYIGTIGQFGLIALFLFYYVELIIYNEKTQFKLR